MNLNLDLDLAFSGSVLSGALAMGAALRARRAVARWAFVVGMVALSAERICSGFLAQASSPEQYYQWEIWQLTAGSLVPGAWLLFSLTYARGNAREFLWRWRYALLAGLLLPAGAVFIFESQLISSAQAIRGEPRLLFRLGPAGSAFQLVQLTAAILVLMNLERTFRASVGTVRWRVKFLLMGIGLLFIIRLYVASQSLLFHTIDTSLETLNSGALLISGLLILRSLFRTGQINLDVYPSHSVLQGSVTILLVGAYLLIVGFFAQIAAYLGGDASFALKALVVLVLLVVLAVLLQSDRVQLYLRRMISRHFQRPLYDYRTVWRKFTEGTASQVEQTEFCRAVVKLLAEIFQTLSVTMWLVDESREELTLATSSLLTDNQATELKPNRENTIALIEQLRENPDPVDIEHIKAEWAAALRRCHPDEFHKGGTRVCVPIVSGGEVQALLILGDRVSGTAFTLQDFDLLKSIGEHVASGLLNARLSQRLLQAREHEAFQTMATFFVHDLKNAATTLNLMLKNLPDHFDDPEFRADALRGVGKSVTHINNLISRLTQLRRELKIQAKDSDLNKVVAAALVDLDQGGSFQIEQKLGSLPPVAMDEEQFTKVIINLVLNSKEAAGNKGHLLLTTSQSGGWAVLTATDDGCGMSSDFLTRSLFRPFQTTKTNGLGIGMFQSKMIVEAHGGRIAVESSPGKGTTFRVFLPIRLASLTP